MIDELSEVVLNTELPAAGLKPGDLGTVVLVHPGGDAYEVEFMTLDGKTIAVVTLQSSQIRPIAPGEIAHVRQVDRLSA